MSVTETSFLVLDIWLPRIRYGRRSITARTGFLLQLASLFSASKRVVIDAQCKTVKISSRTFWFASTSEIISSSEIRYIDISELTVGGSPGYTRDGIGWHDQQENFIPYLMTIDGRKIDLLSFYGELSAQGGGVSSLATRWLTSGGGRKEEQGNS